MTGPGAEDVGPGDTSAAGAVALLVLADGRFPAGGHVHSAGVESAMVDGRVRSVDDLADYVVGRLHTTGLVDASLTAATVVRAGGTSPAADALARLDAEADARIPVEALRTASRRLGRQLVRVAGPAWPAPVLADVADVDPDGPHQSVALGAVAVAAGIGAHDAALVSLHHAVSTPTQAAVRIGGLDPFAVATLVARLGPTVADLARVAVGASVGTLADLPCATGPLVEIAAVHHAALATRLFAT